MDSRCSFRAEMCSGNAKSWLEPVIEHLGMQGQPRGAQLHAMHLSYQKGWRQDPTLPRPHIRAGSGGKDILLEIPDYWRSSKGKQIFFFFSSASVSTAAAFGLVLTCCSLGLGHLTTITVLSISLQAGTKTNQNKNKQTKKYPTSGTGKEHFSLMPNKQTLTSYQQTEVIWKAVKSGSSRLLAQNWENLASKHCSFI